MVTECSYGVDISKLESGISPQRELGEKKIKKMFSLHVKVFTLKRNFP